MSTFIEIVTKMVQIVPEVLFYAKKYLTKEAILIYFLGYLKYSINRDRKIVQKDFEKVIKSTKLVL